MNRSGFVLGLAAAGIGVMRAADAADTPSFVLAERIRPGASLTLAEMLAQYPPPAVGDLLQYELGFGAAYDKQMGFGHEADQDGSSYAFVESQVGNGDHACNPNTLKKVYLKSRTFGNVFTPYPALTYVSRSGNMLTRWGDGVGPAAGNLLLLDTKTLYDPRRATVTSVKRETLTVAGRTIETTRVAAKFPAAQTGQLADAELWLSADVPLGLVKMTATSPEVDPFHLSVYTYHRHFKTELAMSLQTVRTLTPTGDVPVLQN